MRELLFPVEHGGQVGLQTQVRRHLIDAISDGRLTPDEPLPSCRRLARALGVSRNTVVFAYQSLADEGLLIPRERVGYFVNPEIAEEARSSRLAVPARTDPKPATPAIDWSKRLRLRPSRQRQLVKPTNWQSVRYPFIYGQADARLFPVAAWRSCSRQALGVRSIHDWSEDSVDADDPMLIEEIRTRVLPRRGISARPEEILITMGAQNALYLIARLLGGPGARIGIEEPGYVDARNIFELTGSEIVPVLVDREGLTPDPRLETCQAVYVTPSHQSPTTVTLGRERREWLLELSAARQVVLIEDDYEAETNYLKSPSSALKSLDRSGSVIYVGSFSKQLSPGLRIGYMVAPKTLIAEARHLRRAILRHPPANNQRTVALFIIGGHYDALIHRLQRVYHRRWESLRQAIVKHLPNTASAPSFGGTSFWLEGPAWLDAERLAAEALEAGVLIEPGQVHYALRPAPRNVFRLGFSSIPEERIAPGVEILAGLIERQR